MNRRSFLRRTAGMTAVGGVGALGVGLAQDDGDARDAPSALVAGSLQTVASDVGSAVVEARGSLAVRRLVVDGLREPDAMALADPALFDEVCDRATLFATNALVVAYDPDSTAAAALQRNWREAIADPSLALGRTDPERDPLGYRTVMALRLAEGVDAESVLDGAETLPETGLLRTLEGGALDAAFAYRNMAVAHDLPYVELPDSIDFSDPDRADRYASATVELSDRTVRGAPIRYAAAALTADGESWIRTLTRARQRLRTGGFGVPDGYPTVRAVGT